MKTIIAGSRDITDYQLVCSIIEKSGINVTEVVCGCARGVDSIGRKWAGNGNRVPVKMFPADWDNLKYAAGPVRNQEMADYAEALIAIWDGKSPGTKDMIRRAKKKGLRVYVHILGSQEVDGILQFMEN